MMILWAEQSLSVRTLGWNKLKKMFKNTKKHVFSSFWSKLSTSTQWGISKWHDMWLVETSVAYPCAIYFYFFEKVRKNTKNASDSRKGTLSRLKTKFPTSEKGLSYSALGSNWLIKEKFRSFPEIIVRGFYYFELSRFEKWLGVFYYFQKLA